MAVFTPVDKGPSQPDLTQEARKIELSVLMLLNLLPSATLRPSESYQKVREGEQPVALREKGKPTQALTSFTACVGGAGSRVTLSVTSLEARTQEPAGTVLKRAKALSFKLCEEGAAMTESTGSPFKVQV